MHCMVSSAWSCLATCLCISSQDILTKMEKGEKTTKETFMLQVLRLADKIELKKRKEEVRQSFSCMIVFTPPAYPNSNAEVNSTLI